MDKQKHASGMPANQEKGKNVRTASVAKKVIAGTLGLSLLQLPLLASADSGITVTEKAATPQATQGSGSAASKGLNPADAKITKAQAEARARSLFPILKEARLDSITYGEQNVLPPNTKKVWELNWSIQKGNHSSGFSTEVDAITGDILSFYYPSMWPQEDSNTAYYPPAVSKQEAEKIAETFISKAAPSIKAGTMKPSTQYGYSSNKTLFGPVRYSFSYSVDVNGIPADNEYVSLDVDGNGSIVRFTRSTFQGDLPSAKAAISKEEAEKWLEQGLSVKLAYISTAPLLDTSAKREWKIGYIPDRALVPIDAHSGKGIDTIWGKDLDKANQAVRYTALTPSNEVFTPHKGGQLTADQALERLQGIAPGTEYQFQSNLGNYWNWNKQVWNLQWNKRTPGIYQDSNKHAVVDAETGQLLAYNEFEYTGSEPAKAGAPAITEAQARTKAIELVLAHYPNAAEVLKLSDTNMLNPSSSKTVYQFVFQRFYKDLPIKGSTVSVSIDGNGKLISYNVDSYLADADLQAMDALTAKISPKEAQERLLDELGVELRYISSGGYTVDNTYVEPYVRLAYVPTLHEDRNLGYIDGVTGKTEVFHLLPDPSKGQSYELPSDAVNHKANKDLATLLEYRVLSPSEDGLLHPDAELTLGDWIQMMAKGLDPDQGYYGGPIQQPIFTDVPAESPIAQAVQLFADKGWFGDAKSTELHPEQKLTREAVATSLTTALHYSRLSKFFQQDAQALSLSDANAIKDKGAVALMLKLGLMEATGGKFDPAKPVTRAEAATIMVRLAHLQGNVDTPLNQR